MNLVLGRLNSKVFLQQAGPPAVRKLAPWFSFLKFFDSHIKIE